MTRTRLNPKERREQILSAAASLARVQGYKNITRDAVASAAGVSVGLVTTYFNTMPQFRRDLMRYAVRNEIAEIIGQGLMHQDPQAQKVPPEKRRQILDKLGA